ncbi:hypothetical protein RZS08_47980, partial [Arthrospira platensis SPKY1]|nr:hypothetical protein [Arthrospira platensis SPKY1]
DAADRKERRAGSNQRHSVCLPNARDRVRNRNRNGINDFSVFDFPRVGEEAHVLIDFTPASGPVLHVAVRKVKASVQPAKNESVKFCPIPELFVNRLIVFFELGRWCGRLRLTDWKTF